MQQQYSIPDEIVQLLIQVQNYLQFRGENVAVQLYKQIQEQLSKRVYKGVSNA